MVEASFESARIQKWGKKKTTRHGCIVNGIVHRTSCQCSSSAGVEALELHPCFLAFGVFEQRKRDIKINIWKPMFKKCCFITHSFERLYTQNKHDKRSITITIYIVSNKKTQKDANCIIYELQPPQRFHPYPRNSLLFESPNTSTSETFSHSH